MSQQIRNHHTATEELKKGITTKTQALQACQDMLSKTHMVLATCKEFHAQKESPLAPALAETCSKVHAFLESI
jgi:hypothetical protein